MKTRRLAVAAVLSLAPAMVVGSLTASAITPTFQLHDAGVNGPELNLDVAPSGSIVVGGWDAIGRSTDNGSTWSQLLPVPVLSAAADRVLIVDHGTGRVI